MIQGASVHILLLSDGIVGHYKQSEGVVAALARQRTVTVTRHTLAFPSFLPRKILPHLAKYLPPALFLKLCGISPAAFPTPDLIVSAGGATLGANVALAAYFKIPNIFSGSARGFSPQRITLTLLPYPSARSIKGHLYTLKPSTVDPDTLPPARPWNGLKGISASLLIGGATKHMPFTAQEWTRLIRFAVHSTQENAIRWNIVTSRRTPESFYAVLDALPPQERAMLRITDYRQQGAGSIDAAYSADLIAVTGDSLSMVSEAVATGRRTLVLLAETTHPFRDGEAVASLAAEQRLTALPIAALSIDVLEKKLSSLTPFAHNHLDVLGKDVLERLPL